MNENRYSPISPTPLASIQSPWITSLPPAFRNMAFPAYLPVIPTVVEKQGNTQATCQNISVFSYLAGIDYSSHLCGAGLSDQISTTSPIHKPVMRSPYLFLLMFPENDQKASIFTTESAFPLKFRALMSPCLVCPNVHRI